jgi:hypothetical protein
LLAAAFDGIRVITRLLEEGHELSPRSFCIKTSTGPGWTGTSPTRRACHASFSLTPPTSWEIRPVSPLVNSPKNDTAQLIDRFEDVPEQGRCDF